MIENRPANDDLFRLIFECSLDGIIVFDDLGRYLLANQAACTLLGYDLTELLTKSIVEIPSVGPQTTSEVFRAYQQTGRDAGRFHFFRPDGSQCAIDYTAIRISADKHIGILRDATASEKVLLDLQRFAAIVASSTDSFVCLSTDAVVTEWNSGAERLYGYRKDEMLGRPMKLLMLPERMDEAFDIFRRVLGGENVHNRETVLVRKDGVQVNVSVTTSPIKDARDNVVGISTIAHDISDRKALERHVLEVADHERRRIGQDLHDDLGQELTGLGLMASSLAATLAKMNSPTAQVARNMHDIIKNAVSRVQAISRGLIPVSIDAGGLPKALEALAERVTEQGPPNCTFTSTGSLILDDIVTANELYRIAQEAVNNAIKHAQARHIWIELSALGQLTVLRISDDGIGLPSPLAAAGGMGLRIMRYRADLVGAQLNFEQAPAGGLIVACTLPAARRT